MVIDYYSEDIPASKDEKEVYELIPETKTPRNQLQNEEPIEPAEIIVEDDNKNRLHMLNKHFESKMKTKILFSSNSLDTINDKDSIKRNRLLKFTILENELRALMLDIKNDSDDDQLPLRNKVDSLINDINDFKMNNGKDTFVSYWNKQLEKPINEMETEPLDVNIPVCMESSNEFIKLESRITSLEKVVGDVPLNQPAIQDAINDLYRCTNIMLDGGETYKNIEVQVLKLLENCNLYLKNSKKIKDKFEIIPLTDIKLTVLYERVKQLPDFEIFSKKVIERFKSLHKIILDTSHTVEFMKGLENELTTIEARLDDWEEKLDTLEFQFKNKN